MSELLEHLRKKMQHPAYTPQFRTMEDSKKVIRDEMTLCHDHISQDGFDEAYAIAVAEWQKEMDERVRIARYVKKQRGKQNRSKLNTRW